MTSAPKPDKQKSKPKRKWLRRVGWTIAALLLVFTIFHQLILTALIRFAAHRLAARANLNLQFDMKGYVLTGLTFENVSALPTGKSPIEKITAGKVRLSYSIMSFIRHGSRNFVKELEVKDLTMAFKGGGDDPAKLLKEKTRPSHLAEDMQHWFFPPVVFVARADIENLNITTRDPDGDFIMQSAELHYDRGTPGSIKIALMQIPRLKTWTNIDARLTATENDFALEEVHLTPDILVEKITSTPTREKGKPDRIALEAKIFGGHLSAEYATTKVSTRYNSELHGSFSKFGFDGLRKFLNVPAAPISGDIDHFDVQFAGDPDVPSSWQGTSTTTITAPATFGAIKIDQARANLVLDKGVIKIESIASKGEFGKATVESHGQLPGRLKELPAMAMDGRFQLVSSDLSQCINAVTHGAVMAEGHFNLQNREFKGDVVASGKEINSEKFDVALLDLKGEFTRSLRPQEPRTDFLEDTRGRITAQFKDARADKYAFDSGVITAELKDGWVQYDATDIKRAENTITTKGSLHLPRDFSKIAATDFDIEFSVLAPNAAAFNSETNLNGINGNLETRGKISHRNGFFEGNVDIAGTKIASPDFTAESLNAGITIEKSVVNIRNLTLVMDPKNRLSGNGTIGLGKPYDYEGKVQADIANLSVFNPLLRTLGAKETVAGALTVDWSGSGEVSELHHTGQGKILLTGGKYGTFQPITAQIEGNYSPQSIDIPIVRIRVDKTNFTAAIDLHDTQLKIHDVLLQQEKTTLLRGGIMFPVDLRTPTNPDSLIPNEGKIFANLSSDEINLETLLIKPKQTSPLKGFVKLSINADGNLDSLPANILLRGRNLQIKATPEVAPATLELNCDLRDNQLALNGSLLQPAISPLKITGRLPFSLKQLLKEKHLDENAPVDISIKLDKSPVTIIGQLAKNIRYIEGQMGIDIKAVGTIAKPVLSGAATLDLPAIRMRDPNAPAINGFKGSMDFAGNQLTIHRFGGEISGGPFDITGKVVFEKLTAPVLDLRLTSKNALLLRNETLTVRADADLKIAGVFNAAAVTGNAALTKSKFFREVEILPIELPGRPAPKPPSEMQMGFKLKPPLANWTFDVAIKTKDPFLVRGNLANGAASIDVKLIGTGASPSLDGLVRIDSFLASLPFSRLNIEYGYVYFTADNPFVPSLDIQGVSSLRDYNIHVYISGTPNDPVTVFTSDPPLPQEEIIALLGTGATTEELTGKGDVLAGRAAVLVFQKFYRKVFKQKPHENESFLSRFELDPGAVDPRTGKQEVSARFKASDQVQIIGDLDAEGGMRAQIRYLLRFR